MNLPPPRRTLRFVVPGIPGAKGRPRAARTATGVRTYTPQKTVDFENRVRLFAQQAGVTPIAGPVALSVVCRYSLPKSKHRKRVPVRAAWKTSRPDVDNVAKAVADALNGIGYQDDSQIARLVAEKWEAAQGEPAETIVELREL